MKGWVTPRWWSKNSGLWINTLLLIFRVSTGMYEWKPRLRSFLLPAPARARGLLGSSLDQHLIWPVFLLLLCMFEEISAIKSSPFFLGGVHSHYFFLPLKVCLVVRYRRSAVERLCPGRREEGWAARCCRSPWRSPGTLSRSMACAYWLNGAGRWAWGREGGKRPQKLRVNLSN